MYFTRNCDCVQASFGSDSRVLMAETILKNAGVWCRLAPGQACGMVLVIQSDDRARAEELLREMGYSPERMVRTC
jgi:hypothetical protein